MEQTEDKSVKLWDKGLAGLCFLQMGEDNQPRFQGVIRSVFGNYAIIQYFSWLTGEPNNAALWDIDKFVNNNNSFDEGAIMLFEDAESLRLFLKKGD